MNWLISCTIIW